MTDMMYVTQGAEHSQHPYNLKYDGHEKSKDSSGY